MKVGVYNRAPCIEAQQIQGEPTLPLWAHTAPDVHGGQGRATVGEAESLAQTPSCAAAGGCLSIPEGLGSLTFRVEALSLSKFNDSLLWAGKMIDLLPLRSFRGRLENSH